MICHGLVHVIVTEFGYGNQKSNLQFIEKDRERGKNYDGN